MKNWWIIALTAAIIVVTTVASLLLTRTDVDASQDLRFCHKNGPNANYVASVNTSVFYGGHELSTRSTVYHTSNGEHIRYLSEPTAGTVVITADGETRTYSPSTKQIQVSRVSKNQDEHGDLDLLLRNYRAVLVKTEMVAGRQARLIEVKPKYKGNPSKRIWIDSATGVILKSEYLSATGKLRSRTEFTKISYNGEIPADILGQPEFVDSDWIMREQGTSMSVRELENVVGVAVTEPGYLPKGYVIEGVRSYSCECNCGHKAAHLRYTNGLGSISVFKTPAQLSCGQPKCKVHCPPSGRCETKDADQAQVAVIATGDSVVIAVADLPKAEIVRVAKSVARRTPAK